MRLRLFMCYEILSKIKDRYRPSYYPRCFYRQRIKVLGHTIQYTVPYPQPLTTMSTLIPTVSRLKLYTLIGPNRTTGVILVFPGIFTFFLHRSQSRLRHTLSGLIRTETSTFPRCSAPYTRLTSSTSSVLLIEKGSRLTSFRRDDCVNKIEPL